MVRKDRTTDGLRQDICRGTLLTIRSGRHGRAAPGEQTRGRTPELHLVAAHASIAASLAAIAFSAAISSGAGATGLAMVACAQKHHTWRAKLAPRSTRQWLSSKIDKVGTWRGGPGVQIQVGNAGGGAARLVESVAATHGVAAEEEQCRNGEARHADLPDAVSSSNAAARPRQKRRVHAPTRTSATTHHAQLAGKH